MRRAFESLAFLALSPGRRAHKDQLVDAVWHDAAPRSIEKNFHPTLSEARRALGHREVFVYRQGQYALNPDFEWRIDVDDFTERVLAGRRCLERGANEEGSCLEPWLDAWKLYRGPLLAGCEAPWIESRREAECREYAGLLRAVGELAARLDRTTLALDAYRSLLLEEPFEERVHTALMELYARQGRRDLVRRQFVRMQGLLLEELSVEPLAETLERYHQLMR